MVQRFVSLLIVLFLVSTGAYRVLAPQKQAETPKTTEPAQSTPVTPVKGVAVPVLYYHLIDDHL